MVGDCIDRLIDTTDTMIKNIDLLLEILKPDDKNKKELVE